MSKSIKYPIFILSAGWRSGSTMLQRLFVHSGKVLVWGESGGALNNMREAYEAYEQMLGDGGVKFSKGYGGFGKKQFDEFRKKKIDRSEMWMACMNPSENKIKAAFKSFFEEVYTKDACELSYEYWGIKDVLANIETAKWLKFLYPEAKFVFLIRNPMDCLLSIKRRNWMDKNSSIKALEFYTRHWKKLAKEFREADFGKVVHYEELINNKSVLNELSEYTGISELNFDFIKKSKVDWKAEHSKSLNLFEKFYIRKVLSSEAMLHGYQL